ncbi:MAG TPA: class I SAM-dependent methyltransferase [Vicinamibacteria bacterium]|nr:class I SAM-dependent methyltransferase [Vicinamibacteria bacterium]
MTDSSLVASKEQVRSFWEATPCGTRGFEETEGSAAYFERLERERDEREPFIASFARFAERRGRRVLEVGVGAGTDFVRFARAGAALTGVDLTQHAVDLALRRLEREGLAADVRQADAERLPFPDENFDFVYSWGVIHHTSDPAAAAREIVRVLAPGGETCVMVYHRHSLVALQCWVLYALLAGRPWRSLREVVAAHVESAGTQAYTVAEARALFPGLAEVRVNPVVTPYDLRVSRSGYLPRWALRFVPRRLGWFLVVTGRKPEARNE